MDKFTSPGRPEKLTGDIRRYIYSLKEKFPKRTARKIQDDVRLYLLGAKKGENSKLKPELRFTDEELAQRVEDEELPGISAIGKYLTELKERRKNPDFIEKGRPWQLGTTVKDPIPAEAIPRILEMQEWLSETPARRLSVREAKWIGHLYHVKGLGSLTLLWKACKLYSDLEVSCELAGVALDTGEWDKSLIKGTLEQDILEAFAPPSFTGNFEGYKPGTFEIGGELKP